jgi:hypothetical protein
MVLTAYFGLSLVIGLSCHHHRCDAEHRHRVDTSVEMSGPHGFAVRCTHRTPYDRASGHRTLPRVRDDREPPLLVGQDGTRRSGDLPVGARRKFLEGNSALRAELRRRRPRHYRGGDKAFRLNMRLKTTPLKAPAFLVSHSQITTTFQPSDRSSLSTRLSRRTFEENFFAQNGEDGAVAFGHRACLCQ